MATVVNNPGDGNGGSAGWIVAIIAILALLLIAFFAFGDNREAAETVPQQIEDRAENMQPPTVNNTFNSTTTINNSTTTDR